MDECRQRNAGVASFSQQGSSRVNSFSYAAGKDVEELQAADARAIVSEMIKAGPSAADDSMVGPSSGFGGDEERDESSLEEESLEEPWEQSLDDENEGEDISLEGGSLGLVRTEDSERDWGRRSWT